MNDHWEFLIDSRWGFILTSGSTVVETSEFMEEYINENWGWIHIQTKKRDTELKKQMDMLKKNTVINKNECIFKLKTGINS